MDEVPTQAPDSAMISLSIASDSGLTANLSPALTRGAGVCTLSVGSRCPRRKLCGGVNPSNPPMPAMGFARRKVEVSRSIVKASPPFERAIVLPLEGKGDRSAVDEVT